MRNQLGRSLMGIAAVAISVVVLAMTQTGAQTSAGQSQIPRTADGKPNLNGIWQAVGTAHWNLEGSEGAPAPAEAIKLGAVGAIPPGLSVVEGGRIPYQPWAATKRDENTRNWVARDPEVRCFLPGVPRATYLPYPFQIFQSGDLMAIVYQFHEARRVINMKNHKEAPIDFWMGWSNGRWEGDTLVIDVTAQNDHRTPDDAFLGLPEEPHLWLDRAGNFYGEDTTVVERYTPLSANHLIYEATIEDTKVYTRPWKINMPLYRRIEKNAQLLEFKCSEHVEELLYGRWRRRTPEKYPPPR